MSTYIKVPVVWGQQGGHEFFIGSISAGMLVHIIRFTDPTLPPKERAQRIVSIPAAKGICSYITENPNSYHFNNVELSIMGPASFDSIPGHPQFGYLTWLENVPVLVNDGQTRSKAFELAIAINRALLPGRTLKWLLRLTQTWSAVGRLLQI